MLHSISNHSEIPDSLSVLPFTYTVCGEHHGFCISMTNVYANITPKMKECGFSHQGGEIIISYLSEEENLLAKVHMQLIEGADVIQQWVTVTNIGKENISLTALTSAVIPMGIVNDHKSTVSYCRQNWQGEGQWFTQDFEELGLTELSAHPPTASFSLVSQSTQTTAKYFPNHFINHNGNTIFCELLPFASWHMEVALKRGWEGCRNSAVLQCGCALERELNFLKTLKSGESYTSAACLYGVCKNGMQEAVKQQYKARRQLHKRRLSTPLVCFNDYMNCLWANPDEERTLSLLNSAAKLGADAYVIDAGWFTSTDKEWHMSLGDWKTDTDRFGKDGLYKMIQIIKAHGLIPGIWFEIEVAGEQSDIFKKPDDWFVTRAKKRVGGGARVFFNFTNPEVKAYLRERIAALIDMGIDIIKNDYNDSYAYFGDEEPTYMVQQNQQAVHEFFDELMNSYPNLIVENCASGAMRSDGYSMSQYYFQSVSDQENYRLYPSIIKGSMMNLLPEQLGIWAMPGPVAFSQRNNTEFLHSEIYSNCFADGEQTIFNMVNGLTGLIYLSGRIDVLDDKNQMLVKEGIELFRQKWDFVRNSYPEFPLGLTRIKDKDWDALILSDEEISKKLLYVWRLNACNDQLSIDIGDQYTAKQIYPKISHQVPITVSGGNMTVAFKSTYSARIFELTRII